MTKTRSDRHNSCCETLFYYWQVVSEWGRNTFLFLVFTNNAHNRQWLGTDVGRLYQIYSDYANTTGKAGRNICHGKDQRWHEVICTVWSPGLADTSDHTGWVSWKLWQDLTVLLPRPVSTVNQNASDMRFTVRGRVRESRASTACQTLIGEWVNTKGLSQKETWFFFFSYSMPAVHTAILRCFIIPGGLTEQIPWTL